MGVPDFDIYQNYMFYTASRMGLMSMLALLFSKPDPSIKISPCPECGYKYVYSNWQRCPICRNVCNEGVEE